MSIHDIQAVLDSHDKCEDGDDGNFRVLYMQGRYTDNMKSPYRTNDIIWAINMMRMPMSTRTHVQCTYLMPLNYFSQMQMANAYQLKRTQIFDVFYIGEMEVCEKDLYTIGPQVSISNAVPYLGAEKYTFTIFTNVHGKIPIYRKVVSDI